MFEKNSGSGVADHGKRYDPLTGAALPTFKSDGWVGKPYARSDSSTVSLSNSLQLQQGTLHRTSKPTAATTRSYQEWTDNMRKHVRSQLDNSEKYAQPVTTSQETGWSQTKVQVPTHGRIASRETKIAEQQILGPRSIEHSTIRVQL